MLFDGLLVLADVQRLIFVANLTFKIPTYKMGHNVAAYSYMLSSIINHTIKALTNESRTSYPYYLSGR